MKPFCTSLLSLVLLCLPGFESFSAKDSEYGDIIKETPEYKKITTPKADDGDDDRHYYHYHYPHYPYGYPPRSSAYYRSTGSGSERVGLSGNLYFGITVGQSEFDYNDIEDGDALIFRLGYRPENSHLGYELSFFDSGDADVTSLSDIEIEVDSINFVLTLNSAKTIESRFNLFGQAGIYLADTTLSGPFDSVSEDSNGFLMAVGVDIMLNQHFSLRTEYYNFFDVEDFADDESIAVFNLGGHFVF